MKESGKCKSLGISGLRVCSTDTAHLRTTGTMLLHRLNAMSETLNEYNASPRTCVKEMYMDRWLRGWRQDSGVVTRILFLYCQWEL